MPVPHGEESKMSELKAQSSKSKLEFRSKGPAIPRPSASIILISPTNQVLLLHRVKKASSFPSAHVFPGGNLEEWQDGEISPPGLEESEEYEKMPGPDDKIPGPDDECRHQDSLIYRRAAIRECFEESGILLALRRGERTDELLVLTDKERTQGRQMVHANKVRFSSWVQEAGATVDTDGLIPFTRWITPTIVKKRFTTQMYIYFLPFPSSIPRDPKEGSTGIKPESVVHNPTDDGGKEHTSARFLPASKWLAMAQSGEIILFPPQFFLLHLLAPFLSPENVPHVLDNEQLEQQRTLVKDFVKSGDPSWMEKCISPTELGRLPDGRFVMDLSHPGFELDGSDRKGDDERVVLVNFKEEGTRELEVAWKEDMLKEIREKGKL